MLVTDIVAVNYRAADIFQQLDIDFCCGGRRSLQAACEARNLDVKQVEAALHKGTRPVVLPTSIDFNNWSIDFLADYIINIHHTYLAQAVVVAAGYLDRFAKGHQKKFSYAETLQHTCAALFEQVTVQMQEEEASIFPYVRQIAHAFAGKEPYARLLVKTLRKPLEILMNDKQQKINERLQQVRQLTGNYTTPPDACITHRVTFFKLREIDQDIMHHLYLENQVLFPKAIRMENELLNQQN